MERERLGSRLGFILLSAGCAIGVGNVWKFPWMAGQYGGGAFVLLYLIFLIILGLPVMTIEFSVGRAAQASPVRMYQKLEPKGTKWHIHGYAALIGCVLLMMFYTSVTGWILYYFVHSLAGNFVGLDAGQDARGMVVVEALAAELKIELAPEFLDAFAYLLGLLLDIKVVIESHFEHCKTSQYIFCA